MSKTDKELFREYLMSKEPGNGEDTIFKLYFTGFECFGMDDMLSDVVNSIVNADPEPVEELDFLMQEVGGLLKNIIRVRRGFLAYKVAQGGAA